MAVCVRLFYCLAALSCYWKVSISQTVTISADAGDISEGQSLNISCVAPSSSSGTNLVIEIDSVRNSSIPRDVNGRNAVFTLGPLTRMENGSTIRCRDLLEGISSNIYVLVVNFATCDSGLITVQVNLEETPISLASNISGNPDVFTISCMTDGGSELPSGNIDLRDDTTSLIWNRADFTIIDVYAGTVQVTCAVQSVQTIARCSSPLHLTVNYDAAPCGDVSGCLATVLVVVLVVAIALAVGITVTVVVVIKKK